MSSKSERLTAVHRRIREKGIASISHRRVRDLAIEGAFPAYQINNVWHYDVKNLDLIIKAIESRRAAITARLAA